ncbi:MAG: MBL fold metallo-hydrolase [Candidatus Sericytochromatia bacterium]
MEKINETVNVRILEGGYCTHKEKMVIKGGKNEATKFPSMFGLFIHSKKGVMLYDTGYTKRFYIETSKFPFNIYAKLTPVYVEDRDTAVNKLKIFNIKPEDVKYIIISHFHADHIAALKDFPEAKFIYMKNGYDKVKNLKGLSALKQGYLSGLLPNDFEKRSIILDTNSSNLQITPIEPFSHTFDLFEDGSIKIIPLEGHYRGQIGALVNGIDNKKYFFIADSCWLSKSFRDNIPPHFMANIIMDNSKEYKSTLSKINKFYKQNPDVEIIPSHCGEIYGKYLS